MRVLAQRNVHSRWRPCDRWLRAAVACGRWVLVQVQAAAGAHSVAQQAEHEHLNWLRVARPDLPDAHSRDCWPFHPPAVSSVNSSFYATKSRRMVKAQLI